MIRRTALAMSLVVVAWAAVAVPMPFFEIRPGGAHAVEELITLSAATSEVDGDLDLLTVVQTTPNILEATWVAIDPDRGLQPATERFPPDVDPETYNQIQTDAFRTSFLTAVAVAAEEVGFEVELATTAVVAQVLADGPSDDELRAGDQITSVGGTSVDSADELVELLGDSPDPRPVSLRVTGTDGDTRDLTIDMRPLDGSDQAVLGILVETVAEDPDLPFDAQLADTNIVGPSAGLMIALTATDELLEEDLTDGRIIAGTGTIARDGSVGPIGGIAQKARAAVEAHADLLLVPIDQVAEARPATEAGIEVVGVQTFQDALDAIRGAGTGMAAG